MSDDVTSTGSSAKRRSIGRIVAVIGVLALVVLFFLPLSSETGDYREYLLSTPDEEFFPVEGLSLTNGEMADVSLFEYVRIYAYVLVNAEEIGTRNAQIDGVDTVLIVIYALFALCSLLTARSRSGVGTLILVLISCGAYWALCFDFADRGAVPGTMGEWGVAHNLHYAAFAVIAVGAVVMMVEGHREKKRLKASKEAA